MNDNDWDQRRNEITAITHKFFMDDPSIVHVILQFAMPSEWDQRRDEIVSCWNKTTTKLNNYDFNVTHIILQYAMPLAPIISYLDAWHPVNGVHQIVVWPSQKLLFCNDVRLQRIECWDVNGRLVGSLNVDVSWMAIHDCGPKSRMYMTCQVSHLIKIFEIEVIENQVFFLFFRSFGVQGVNDGCFQKPGGICISSNEIYIADSGNSRIQCFDLEGLFLRKWGCRGNKDGEFYCVFSIAIHPSQPLVFVSDNFRIQAFDKLGRFLYSFYPPKPTETSLFSLALWQSYLFVTTPGLEGVLVYDFNFQRLCFLSHNDFDKPFYVVFLEDIMYVSNMTKRIRNRPIGNYIHRFILAPQYEIPRNKSVNQTGVHDVQQVAHQCHEFLHPTTELLPLPLSTASLDN